MADLAVYSYILLNLFIIFRYYKKEMGVFQFPFLIACVSLTFVAPQLFNLLDNNYFDKQNSSMPLFFLSLCNIALAVGYNIGNRKQQGGHTVFFKNTHGFKLLIYIFFAIGTVAMIINRGVYQGGFVSGKFVIVSFFTTYATISLLLILIGLKRGLISGKLFYILGIIVIALTLDKIIESGRRAATINLVLMILFFYLDKNVKIYKYLKFVVPGFFVAGMLFGSNIEQYRKNAYSGKTSFIENLQTLDFSDSKKSASMQRGEIFNAFEGMKMAYMYDVQDYGASNWNGIVRDYVPTVLVSRQFKESLISENKTSGLVSRLTKSGSTMTGYFDAFLSFSIFGFIKFMIIGWAMGYLWKRKDKSDISLLFYFVLLTPGLHLLTHSSNYFVSQWVFLLLFVYPFLRMQVIRR